MPRKAILIFGAVLLITISLRAQFQGKVSGLVTDANGAPLEGVSVTIVSQRTSTQTSELTTDKGGKFLQVGLIPGYYQINIKKSGFMPASKEIRVGVAEESRVEVQLQTAEAQVEKLASEADREFLKGNRLYAEQKYAEAAEAYGQAVQLSPGAWGYYLNLGLALKKMDKKAEAAEAFQKAVELNPDSYSSNKEFGEALARDGAFEAAKKYYQKAESLSPEDPDAHFNLGACLINTGEPEAALRHFQRTVELKMDYADAYFQIGTICIGQNKVPEAVQNLETFVALAPDHEKAAVARQLLEYLKKK